MPKIIFELKTANGIVIMDGRDVFFSVGQILTFPNIRNAKYLIKEIKTDVTAELMHSEILVELIGSDK